MKLISILIIAAVAAALSGCGGGGGGGGIVDPPVDVTGPIFHSLTAVYNYSSGDATIIANVTDSSGISGVRAYVNGASTGTDMLLSTSNTYMGTYPDVADNYGDTSVVYTVIVFATDAKGNATSSQTTFSVPPFGPPPPPTL